VHWTCDSPDGFLRWLLFKYCNQSDLELADEQNGWTALHWACHNAKFEMCQALVDYGMLALGAV
jgi:ankyrin repeat protein